MSLSIRINPKTAQLYEGDDVLKSVPTERFYEAVVQRFSFAERRPLGVLPPRVIWVSAEHAAVVFERPPQDVSILFQSGNTTHTQADQVFEVPLPWTIYAAVFNDIGVAAMWMYARPAPMEPNNTALFHLAMPNLSQSGEVCFGPTFHGFYREYLHTMGTNPKDASLSQCIVALQSAFWGGTFNNDYPAWAADYKMPTAVPGSIRDNIDETSRSIAYLQWLENYSAQSFLAVDFMPSNVWTEHDTLDVVIERHVKPVLDEYAAVTALPKAPAAALINIINAL